MKILDRYILTSFLTTFITVFVILFFIFILQGIWLFIAELAGKDLDAWLIAKFLIFYSPKIVPLVLPLSILLASIMTFGNFAENYEFAAMKSSGISLGRAMRGLTVFIVALSIVAFFFANDVIPKAEYKFINLRKSIIQRQPAMAIVEGQFNTIGDFNIKVDKKSGENGEQLTGVTIHKRNPNSSYATIIRSKTGLLKSSEDSNLLQLELFDGYYYEEIRSKNPAEHKRQPFAKSSFTKQIMNIDLTMLNSNDTDEEHVAHTNSMLNVKELNYTIDSLENNYRTESKNIVENIVQRTNAVLAPPAVVVKNRPSVKDSVEVVRDSVPEQLLNILKKDDKLRVLDIAESTTKSSDYAITAGQNDLLNKQKNINGHWHALYEKFVIAFACILMFFIGAPLGAIIRKGGLGLPIVFAVLIFIVFHFINTFGKKMAQENGIPPFLGAWMSSFVLSPLAVLLTYRATNDIGLINMDNVLLPLQKLFSKKAEVSAKDRIVDIGVNDNDNWQLMENYTDAELINMVKRAKQFKYTEQYRIDILRALSLRGITQEELLMRNELYDSNFEKLNVHFANYKKQTNTVLVTYFLSFIISAGISSPNIVIILAGFINLILFYTFLVKSNESLKELSQILNKKVGIGIIGTIILGFPFFIFIYLYERATLKEAISQYN